MRIDAPAMREMLRMWEPREPIMAPTEPDGINSVTVSCALDWCPYKAINLSERKIGDRTIVRRVARRHVIVAQAGEHLNLCRVESGIKALLGH